MEEASDGQRTALICMTLVPSARIHSSALAASRCSTVRSAYTSHACDGFCTLSAHCLPPRVVSTR